MNFVINDHNIVEILIVTYLVSFLLVFLSKKLAFHIGAIDMPNERKVHQRPMPRLGGIAVYGAFLFGYIMYGSLTTQMLSILIASFIIVMLGLIDDIKPLRAKDKLLVQLIAASIVVFYGKLYFSEITLLGLTLVFPPIVNQLIALFFIVGSVNAINLIDGLDGLSSGISSIYFTTISIIAFILNQQQGLDIILCLIMLGSTLGFLTHNFPPAKTFIGDCGSTFLGFMIAVIALLGFKVTTITSLVIPLLILAIPIFDTAFAILRRLLNHKKIGEPDKQHFHHQLLKMKFSPRVSILIIYGINILFSAVSIFYVLGDNKVAMVIYIILMILLLYIVINTDILFEHKNNKRK
ncbi:MAG: undecaprenyl/decaprenyl-phosphate alpha-N-acetylglucosaminyl 1-phosphate transferase [Firmicutes bacterium]|nr:undecaprenyl/decaprenyl-phosphate alpha-N-acetylglucosaminyl 1-phosphate transferase [Bacillota bacterium]